MNFSRRNILETSAGLMAAWALAVRAETASAQDPLPLQFGEPTPFSFEGLIEEARQMAANPYSPPPQPAPEVVQRIDYDAHGKLDFKPEYALYNGGPGVYPITFVHLGQYFSKTVQMFAVEQGMAREVLYSPDYFTVEPESPANELPEGISAFAGFGIRESWRVGEWVDPHQPWVTFMGASYFRPVGDMDQVGLSARGIALNSGGSEPEEFPDFRAFWFEPTLHEGDPVILHALLDGPSVTGAYKFIMTRTKAVHVEVECRLCFRQDVVRLGVAPLTSMFWYSEYPAWHSHDWRPEVHDSDTLVLWTGDDKNIARPLSNPPRIGFSSFYDNNPRGFGLAQRDRNYENYLDGVNYDRRPTCWVEPLEDWGEGAVQLVEIPTDDEIFDNIVAFWLPSDQPRAGDERRYHYRLHWQSDEPFFPTNELAKAVATRVGRGGEAGKARPDGLIKFVIEWDGPILQTIPYGVEPKVRVTTTRGDLWLVGWVFLKNKTTPISEFDLLAEGDDLVELTCHLEMDDEPITEIWNFQWYPEPGAS